MPLYSDGTVARLGLVLLSMLLLILFTALRPRSILSVQEWTALIIVRFTASIAAFYLITPNYVAQGKADIINYHQLGIAVSDSLRNFDLAAVKSPFGTEGMYLLTGLLYAPFGADVFGVFLFSAAMGVGSVLFFLKAALLIWPKPAVRTYGVLIGLLPSLLMWTGVFGKDSWAALALGLWTYGYTLVYARGLRKATPAMAAGFLLLVVVRPHIAMLCAVAAMTASGINGWSITKSRWRRALLLIVVSITITSGALYPVLISSGLSSLSVESLLQRQEASRVGNTTGGSAMEIAPVTSLPQFLAMLPAAMVRIFARPTVFEAHNSLSLIAAFESWFIAGSMLYILCRPRRTLLAIRQSQLMLFSSIMLVFVCCFLASVANLGLLVRERAQLLPFLALLLVGAWKRSRFRVALPRKMSIPVTCRMPLPHRGFATLERQSR